MAQRPRPDKVFKWVLRKMGESVSRRELAEVARQTGISYQTLQHIRNNEIENPGVLTVMALADYYWET